MLLGVGSARWFRCEVAEGRVSVGTAWCCKLTLTVVFVSNLKDFELDALVKWHCGRVCLVIRERVVGK